MIRKIMVLLLLGCMVIYLSGCGTMTLNPNSNTEKVKMTFGG